MKINSTWILKNGDQVTECTSFPYAYRAAYNIVHKTIEAKQNPTPVMRGISIVGPPNLKGDRMTYSYATATQLAQSTGLLSPNGTIESREFKKRKN